MSTDTAGWDTVRRTVLERDDYACRFCGIGDEEHREEHGRGLHAHHVIPDRDGGEDRPENLITVCGSCHRTLEHTHGRAVAEMKRREDYAEDLEGVTRVWRDQRETLDDLDDALGEFADGHPTFADEFGIYKTQNGAVEARELEDATATAGAAQIDSEWAFAVAWGYKEGVIDVVSALDGWTNVPFDDP
jgi:hypothetical protein